MKLNNIKSYLKVITGFLFLLTIGCNSNGPTVKPNYEFSDQFVEYCYFLEGSYWVFQNDSTLVTDSIIVSGIKEAIRYAPTPIAHNYEAVDMYIAPNELNISRYEITAGSYEPEPGEMNSLFRMYFEDGSYQIVFSPKYPIGEEIMLGESIGNYENIEVIESFVLLDNTYNDVWHVSVIVSSKNTEYNYWIAKNKGLIKSLTIIDGQITSLSLVKSNLIPGN